MNKRLVLTLFIFLFMASLAYLHQKVQIYIEAYRLANNYTHYTGLADQRDYLMSNFAKELSLAKINQWAQTQNFAAVDKERIWVVDANKVEQKPEESNKIVLLFKRLLPTSTSASEALAKERNRQLP